MAEPMISSYTFDACVMVIVALSLTAWLVGLVVEYVRSKR